MSEDKSLFVFSEDIQHNMTDCCDAHWDILDTDTDGEDVKMVTTYASDTLLPVLLICRQISHVSDWNARMISNVPKYFEKADFESTEYHENRYSL